MQGLTPDEARVTELKTTLLSKMDVYEQILSKQKYIAGDVSHNQLISRFFHFD